MSCFLVSPSCQEPEISGLKVIFSLANSLEIFSGSVITIAALREILSGAKLYAVVYTNLGRTTPARSRQMLKLTRPTNTRTVATIAMNRWLFHGGTPAGPISCPVGRKRGSDTGGTLELSLL